MTHETITTDNVCGAFALCDNEPTVLIDHPIGPVPCCARCLAKLNRISAGRVVVLATREIGDL